MAFQYFLEEEVDVAIIEVGIGGLFDATNVIEQPTVCGITPIALEHQNILGTSIKEIAEHKAGIMKVSDFDISPTAKYFLLSNLVMRKIYS